MKVIRRGPWGSHEAGNTLSHHSAITGIAFCAIITPAALAAAFFIPLKKRTRQSRPQHRVNLLTTLHPNNTMRQLGKLLPDAMPGGVLFCLRHACPPQGAPRFVQNAIKCAGTCCPGHSGRRLRTAHEPSRLPGKTRNKRNLRIYLHFLCCICNSFCICVRRIIGIALRCGPLPEEGTYAKEDTS